MDKRVAEGMAEVCRELSEYCIKKGHKDFANQFDKRVKIFEIFANKNKTEVIEMTKTTHQKEKEKFEKDRNVVIKELQKVEKRFGSELFKSACNRKLTVDRQKSQTEKDIKEREEELEQLKKGQPLSQY